MTALETRRRHRARVLAGAVAAIATTAVAGWWWRPRRVEVTGVSMAPTLLPGDRLLVSRARRQRVGDLVVVADPTAAGRALVKRVVAVDEGRLRLAGDNAYASTDSRAWGWLPTAAVAGRVRYRYAPPGRSGRL